MVVKVVEVYTAMELSILFLHQDKIRTPSRVLDGFDKANIQRLSDLLFNLYLEF